MSESVESGQINRRGLILGAGGALVAGAVLAGSPAEAAGRDPQGTGLDSAPGTLGSPVTSALGSPPIAGYTYSFVSMYDFHPFYPTSRRTWDNQGGMYTSVTAGPLRATLDVPPGAVLQDVEFYVSNVSGAATYPYVALGTAGSASISALGGPTIPSGAGIQTARAVIGPSYNGPYPLNSRLIVSVDTPTTGTVQVNGARIGYTMGGAELGVLRSPNRVYSGTITSGSTKTVVLPASLIPPGATSVLVNVSAWGAKKAGYVTVHGGHVSRSGKKTLPYYGNKAMYANTIIVPVSGARTIKVHVSKKVKVALDVLSVNG